MLTENFLHFFIFQNIIEYAALLMGTKKCPHKAKDFWYYYACGDILSS